MFYFLWRTKYCYHIETEYSNGESSPLTKNVHGWLTLVLRNKAYPLTFSRSNAVSISSIGVRGSILKLWEKARWIDILYIILQLLRFLGQGASLYPRPVPAVLIAITFDCN
jgi:hypothetical protein